MDKSVLMGVDGWNAYGSEFKMHISAGYGLLPPMVYQTPDQTPVIFSPLTSLLKGPHFPDTVAEKMDMEN